MPDASNTRTLISDSRSPMAAAVPAADAGKPVLTLQDFHVALVAASQNGPPSVDAQVISVGREGMM